MDQSNSDPTTCHIHSSDKSTTISYVFDISVNWRDQDVAGEADTISGRFFNAHFIHLITY